MPVSHIKRCVTGKGNVSKQEVINSVKAIGYLPKDDNEADALTLVEWVRGRSSKRLFSKVFWYCYAIYLTNLKTIFNN